ncbi:indolepyruvate ferredoxin oxidoreductase [Pacificimonas flava]|uniref:Indolepyruvate ferredoxin oxidoreductase n=2 Tax=Pacificimonas TaxID=1960290 RepID=A0A219B776_9SPHN|nr:MULTISPECIES: indolepyruvate ferredoxin oxidoreductase family protein [Pacificimonas]MBZ6378698.1 indolepyruvate ferredoxin oxidoreductase family protein [Pacificimonas aurantium]OWV34034.1 indolepyruvate ferredoxin oxidoreductase [Pacificimonas flava]
MASAPTIQPNIRLSDKYELETGRVYMSGLQALVRLPIVQKRRDVAAGLNTAGFISGYRGSPLGGYDQELWRAKKMLAERDIRFEPGVNEELGATAVWGSQIAAMNQTAKYDGVFGIWYGKGPGLDRAMDVLKHANAAGTSKHGGVLAIVGDDHGAKSSTLPHQSDHNFQAAFVPFLYPASVEEYVDYGLLGLAMSRFAGTWTGFKATADTVETSATVDLGRENRSIIIPDFDMPEGGLSIRPNDVWREEDTRLQRYKGFAAMAFAKANGIDRVVWDTPRPRLGIVTTGKAFADTMEALDELGITEEMARDIGLRIYKVGMPWPLEPDGIRDFCEGLEEILVIEEKREFIEYQIRWQLYNWKESVRPRVVGKTEAHDNDEFILNPDNELTPGMIAHVIAQRLRPYHDTEELRQRLAFFADRAGEMERYKAPIQRAPYFCSGCPHNSSTKVPEGSRALAGIGCHIMALWMDRETETFTQMGGEGVTWVGEAPFVEEGHVFANLGDGTYNHSGTLAIRQAVASGVNITYKILFNDAVAMTGGQPAENQQTPQQIAAQMVAEGVTKAVVLTEDLSRYQDVTMPHGVELKDRDHLPSIQNEFRELGGTTVIIYDQTCAAEKRRRRKRGKMHDPDKRVFINTAVCEGCGDCSVQSNCMSVEPQETEFGRKRKINQSTCNKDYSCLKGFCPSFVEVRGATIKKQKAVDVDLTGVPNPEVASPSDGYNIFVTGIGGTGVLTISAIIGMAAHMEGRSSTTADMAGLAQKGGAVYSHIRVAEKDEHLLSPRIITGGADLVLAFDAVVAADKAGQNLMTPDRTAVVANADISPVSDFVRDRDLDFRSRQVEKRIRDAANPNATSFVAADTVAIALLGDAIGTNMLMTGYAWQLGHIPLKLESINAAIELNGVAIEFNKKAFALGRLLAHDREAVQKMVDDAKGPPPEPISETVEELIERRIADLTEYQNAAYAERYRTKIEEVRAAEESATPGRSELTQAAARALYKLMAYKDEYEVARLYTDGRFEKQLSKQFDGDFDWAIQMSPPLFAGDDERTGRPKKYSLPSKLVMPTLRALAKMKGLRGGPLDIFGRSDERKAERAAIPAYEAELDRLIEGLRADNHELAVTLAALPLDARGFGPVKEAQAKTVAARADALWQKWPGEREAVAA